MNVIVTQLSMYAESVCAVRLCSTVAFLYFMY